MLPPDNRSLDLRTKVWNEMFYSIICRRPRNSLCTGHLFSDSSFALLPMKTCIASALSPPWHKPHTSRSCANSLRKQLFDGIWIFKSIGIFVCMNLGLEFIGSTIANLRSKTTQIPSIAKHQPAKAPSCHHIGFQQSVACEHEFWSTPAQCVKLSPARFIPVPWHLQFCYWIHRYSITSFYVDLLVGALCAQLEERDSVDPE